MGQIFCGDRVLTTEQLQQRVARAASGLASLGVGPGDGVALYLRNDLPYFEAGMAAGALGAYAVPVNWHYTEDEARYLLEDSGVKVLVIHADLLPAIARVIPPSVTVLVAATPPEVQQTYGIAPAACTIPEGLQEWNAWRDGFAPRDLPPVEIPSTIIYTSGTTGRPKGVKRPAASPEQQAAASRMLAASYGFTEYLDNPSAITTAVVGPMYHSAPNAHSNFSVRLGANVHVLPRFDAEDLLRVIQEKKITHLNMVPIMFNRLLKLPEEVKRKYDLSSLKFVAHAAAPVSPPIKKAMIEWWGPVINEYYGSTEMGNVTFCTAEEWLAHPGTVGKPFPFAKVRVIDEDGNDVAPRVVGEVVGRLPGMTDFTYHGDDGKRRKADRQGMIAPGDVGYFDEDGFLYLCSRSSDMIISGGVNIYPAEIEAELHKMPGLADCAVFGIPDEEYGEAVCAVVQPQPGQTLTEAEVRAYLRQHVAGYKVPKRVDFHPDLPREDSGKIFKRKIREPYWEGHDRRI
ncbi:acyl-CoA synthetase [Zavarzinia sp. CC-PAN008]|uniref:acyl-CoA synthetase n=1 Tax=Zavarzinia sp. CC-PAN008 TaxID=3243332 RepID=UPI003F746DD2